MFLFQTEQAAKAQVQRLKKQGYLSAIYERYYGCLTAQQSGRQAKWVVYYSDH